MARKYPEYKHLNLSGISQEILKYWQDNNIFEESISSREGKPSFTFYEGPPSANGLPGIHHVMARSIKDIFCRFKTLEGYQVKRKAGWDTHGLPVELGVEKELGITKEDIGKTISVEAYNEACKKAVMRYTDVWNDLTEKMGYWVDMDDPYITYKSKYMETVWWLLKQIWDKELMYKGYTIQPYSPKAGTGLSSHEVNMPGSYRDVTDTTIIAQFPAIKNEAYSNTFGDAVKADDKVYFLAWTTTPWTLPSNTALTVGKKIEYVMVETFNMYTHKAQKVVLAKNLVGKYFKAEQKDQPLADYDGKGKNIPWTIVWEGVGADLLELRYEQLLPYALPYENAENAFRVISGDFVTTEDGTGIVHTAPTFGADDAKVAKEATPPVPPMLVLDDNENPVPLVDLQGKFTKHMGEYGGRYVKNEYYADGEAPEKSVDVEIAIKLKEENKAFKVEKYVHSYPHCWRTDKPILYYPLDSWFINVTQHKERLVGLNKEINWKPKSTGEGRFGNWLENANDWNLSRSRYWGIPLPIWSTEDGTERKIFGSVEELKAACDEAIKAGLMDSHPFESFEPGNMDEANYDTVDLHRNVVDKVVLLSPKGQPMHRESDLIDVWFDSGAMPYAQLHYPFENKDKFETQYPADFIAEGVDQTRGWFYTLHTIAGLVFDSVAYKNVVSNGLVLDKNGQKMSKRLGNAADPFETILKYGADPVRWYMITNAQPWDNLKFDLEGIGEVQRKFFGTLYNTYSFFALYANIDGFEWNADQQTNVADRPEIDRWVLSRLQVLKQTVKNSFNEYEPTRAGRAMQQFVDEELSNWYVRLCRRRFWKGEMSTDKQMAYETLYECLFTVSQLMSPIAPFFADWLYQNLSSHLPEGSKEKSVHLTYLGEARAELIDERLNDRMKMAQQLSSMVFSLRKRESIKVRQPLQKMMVPALKPETVELIESIQDLVLSEVNVKELDILKDVSGVLVKKVKPDFKKLGPKYGKLMKQIAGAVGKFEQNDIAKLEEQGHYHLTLEGQEVELLMEDVEVSTEDIPGWLVMTENGITVALDITLSEELKNEGIARELVNRIQNLRKDSGLEVTDRIALRVQKADGLETAISENKGYITTETLTETLEMTDNLTEGLEVSFDEINTKIHLEKV
ncbi:isoleucyl-tRNA synthetase [Owenweeksia hongkongensis DSM 17368]|uniref:Isoleucine--tRNA ligase n=1 Tax=Owenweeksia hongkongensis (strain DSM 17368 / CIP 108786 / JCM 12287 / NRRL B-23963 / UST20020801) TaxID=926562 RepID=G8R8E4_OWEHD|nr:isoleucine--tRNA ligase [Owenweeksia hongkongensis]AEV33537.1 isoleucyl-tRNA synthetase [Owenweeksia hongkongensis DSM 17368]